MFLSKIDSVLADDKVTKEEIAEVRKELADVKAAWKALFAKEIA